MAVTDPTDRSLRPASRPGIEPNWVERVPAPYWILALILIAMPAFAGNFVLNDIFGRAFYTGIIALSLMFLAGYGGMVSLVQMSIAGVGGYMVAIFGVSAIDTISLGWPWYVAIPIALVVAVLFGTLAGWLAVRTEGIYTIMITLAIAAAFFYFARQNYVIFNGFSGFNGVLPPKLFGVDWQQAVPFYYLTLIWAVICFLAVLYLSRSPFGLALQGVRDNPRRMAALGFNVTGHRVAAYAFAALLAGIGGILQTWNLSQISPGTAGIGPVIDVLIIAVIGGLRHPIGPFIGAFIFVLLNIFARDALVSMGLSGDRFKLLIGIVFLAIVFWSPDGVLGLWERLRKSRQKDPLLDRGGDSP